LLFIQAATTKFALINQKQVKNWQNTPNLCEKSQSQEYFVVCATKKEVTIKDKSIK